MKKKLTHILLIDDDPATNFINKKAIERLGCAEFTHITVNGKEAIDLLNKIRIDQFPELILIDINMPIMNGWQFVEKYKTLFSKEKPASKLIILSTSQNPDDKEKSKSLELVDGFENKPLTPIKLAKILEKHFPNLQELV